MLFRVGRKCLFFLFFAYLAVAMVGSFTFSLNKPFNLYTDSQNSGIYFLNPNCAIDWVAGEIITIRKANGNLSSVFRNGLIRVFLFLWASVSMFYLAKIMLQTIKIYNVTNLKNSILLKLRI